MRLLQRSAKSVNDFCMLSLVSHLRCNRTFLLQCVCGLVDWPVGWWVARWVGTLQPHTTESLNLILFVISSRAFPPAVDFSTAAAVFSVLLVAVPFFFFFLLCSSILIVLR